MYSDNTHVLEFKKNFEFGVQNEIWQIMIIGRVEFNIYWDYAEWNYPHTENMQKKLYVYR